MLFERRDREVRFGRHASGCKEVRDEMALYDKSRLFNEDSKCGEEIEARPFEAMDKVSR